MGDDGGWGFVGWCRMICRQWSSGYSTVAFVRLCRCTTIVMPGVRWCGEETVAVAGVVFESVSGLLGSNTSSGLGLVSLAGVS